MVDVIKLYLMFLVIFCIEQYLTLFMICFAKFYYFDRFNMTILFFKISLIDLIRMSLKSQTVKQNQNQTISNGSVFIFKRFGLGFRLTKTIAKVLASILPKNRKNQIVNSLCGLYQ